MLTENAGRPSPQVSAKRCRSGRLRPDLDLERLRRDQIHHHEKLDIIAANVDSAIAAHVRRVAEKEYRDSQSGVRAPITLAKADGSPPASPFAAPAFEENPKQKVPN
ncbi:hypothetical protein RlegWSM1455_07150 [Rhizobium laguerreae]|uniref:hypothetical protein n=1 Tax=Rhizobium laguerreae TaxID=1076926 RepID=UPI001E3D1658|nr:hypothetical protein [Rhizobium laguerreae]UFW65791.1 hypothetical protein RlegWSM1455_07150 [Rhizobium laguerreae]